jgi:hypothetical protein
MYAGQAPFTYSWYESYDKVRYKPMASGVSASKVMPTRSHLYLKVVIRDAGWKCNSTKYYTIWNTALGDPILEKSSTLSTASPDAEMDLNVYPNPTSGVVNFSAKSHVDGEVFVHNSTGMVVLNRIVKGSESIDISHLPTGIYFVEFRQGDKVTTQKIIKK